MLTRSAVGAFVVPVLLLFASVAHANPAQGAPFVIHQPDGTSFEARLFGDEWTTVDGYPIVHDADSGYWIFADTTATVGAEDFDRPLATLTLAAPNGGEAWIIGSRRLISWTSTSLSGNVRLEVSRNAGATWTVIVASTANDGALNWTVLGPATNSARVRVCSIATPTLCDTSNANFRIGTALLTVVTPNGGEKWAFNTTRQLQWTTAGSVGSSVRVELSRDAGATFAPIFLNIANDGAQNWLVTGPATTGARIRVCSVATPSVCDTSNASFSIAAGALNVVTPNGGESWPTGSSQQIRWTSSGTVGGNVRVEISRNGGTSWATIFASIQNDLAQNWTVTGPLTANARIRICSVATPSICDTSNASFAITDGRVRVLTPNGGEAWPVGGTRRIEWTSAVAGNVRVEISRNGGTSWTTIFASIEDDGAQNWLVTGPVTTQARIRVCSVAAPAACDTSDAVFAITQAPDLTVRSLTFTPADVLTGQSWMVRMRVANEGVVAAPATQTDIFVGPTSATGTIFIMRIPVPALEPGAVTDLLEKTVAFPNTVPPDTYFVFARVDATGVVPEADEANEFVLLDPTLLVH